MEVIHDLSACPRPASGSAVTIGVFDGVHLGHRALIAEVRARAATSGLASAVVTFDRHPAMVVRPESAPLLLTDLEQRLELIESTGVDYAVVLRFDETRAAEAPEDFVTEVLVDCLTARLVVVGDDFHFGHQRKGNVALLRELGAGFGFEVDGLELRGPDGTPATDGTRVSSTAIRHLLRAGDLVEANALLGREHQVRGLVVTGDRRGRELGFPTANVAVAGDILLPADGIYAGRFEAADGSRHGAAISLGRRPTFYEEAHASLLEAHLLDFDGDLYGQHVRVDFVARLRGEQRFGSAEELIGQMRRDCDQARLLLGP